MPAPDVPGEPSPEAAAAALAQLALAFFQGAGPPASPDAPASDGNHAHPTAVVVLDAMERIRALDAEAERLFGRAAAEVFEVPVGALLPSGPPQTQGPERLTALGQEGRRIPVLVARSTLHAPPASGSVLLVRQDLPGHASPQGSDLRYRNLVEQIPAVVFTAALDGGVYDLYVSPQIEALLGYSQREWIGDPVLWYERLHPDDRRLLDAEFARGCLRGGPFKAECRFLARDGRVVWVHGEARLLKDPLGWPLLVQGVAFDITEAKNAEGVVRASLREKETLLKEIHHRVKNNLQITSSLLRLQADRVIDEAARQALRESQDRIRSMAHVHELLYRSKDLSRIDLGEYVRDVVGQFLRAHCVDRGRIGVETDVEEVLLEIDIAVPCGLMLNELVSNVIQHAFPGDRRGSMRVALHPVEGGHQLTVRDDGVGLPEHLDVEHASTLGLQLVRALVSQIDARFELRSERGTEARITIPGRERGAA